MAEAGAFSFSSANEWVNQKPRLQRPYGTSGGLTQSVDARTGTMHATSSAAYDSPACASGNAPSSALCCALNRAPNSAAISTMDSVAVNSTYSVAVSMADSVTVGATYRLANSCKCAPAGSQRAMTQQRRERSATDWQTRRWLGSLAYAHDE